MNNIKIYKTEEFAGQIEDLMDELREHVGWLNHKPEEVDIDVWKEKVRSTLNKIIQGAQASLEEIA